MPSLKASYPLYLANEALAPNQDLEVTDADHGASLPADRPKNNAASAECRRSKPNAGAELN